MYERFGKRVLDALVAAALLLVLSPLMAFVACAVRLEDRGPALFCQTRSGRDLRPFTLLKFRSMPVSTPEIPSAAARAVRVTRIGRYIRRSNVDELPQLLNILKGDMSIVGPRPALMSQEALIAMRRVARVTRLRPGLTGLAQVNAYDDMPEHEKAAWDARYSAAVSFRTDLAIVGRTFAYVLRAPPAY